MLIKNNNKYQIENNTKKFVFNFCLSVMIMVTITPIMVSTTTNIGFKAAYALNTQSIEGEQNTSQAKLLIFHQIL